IAISGTGLALTLPARYAIVPLGLSMCLHPSTLLMPPAQLSFTPARLIGLVLLLRCIFTPSIRSSFRWRLVDTAALAYAGLLTISMLMNLNVGPALNNRAGFFLSALVPFWCARFLITDRLSLYAFVKSMMWAGVPLAILGVYEMQTTYSPWESLRQYGVFPTPRLGDGWRLFMGSIHARARGPFVQYIMYGWFFALWVALGTNLYFQKRRLGLWVIAMLFLPVGMAASLSGGPKMLAGLAILLMLAYPLRKHWRIGVGIFLTVYIVLLVGSNRGLMGIIADYGTDPLSSWYRVSLVRFVLHEGGMTGHWFVGYGTVPFEQFHDLCIQWVSLLVVYGIAGLIGFYGLIGAVGWSLWKAREHADTTEDQWLLWTMMATLLGSLGAMLVVALFSETEYIYYMLLGVIANASLLVQGATRHVGVLAELDGRPVLLRYTLRPGQRLALATACG
ncbi:MAG: hypothetical protein ACM359_21730, partial [Bacillota bacterium]